MRKAGQAGMWLALMVASWMPVSAMAQEGPPDIPPTRIESDPQLAAANKAWHDAWRANIETHLRTVAARGTPRDLLVAGWLWPMESDETSIAQRDMASGAQARTWIQAAYDGARGDDALVDWTLLDACAVRGATCDRDLLLQRRLAADPGNAEILLTAYQRAVERGDTVAAERYWQAAAAGSRYRSRINDVGMLMASVLREVPAPALDPALAAAMGEDYGIGRPATPRDLADMAVLALNAAIAIPTLQPVRQRCRAQIGRLPAETSAQCRRLYALFAADESTLLGPMIALTGLAELADYDAEGDRTRATLRRFAWVYENTMRLYQLPPTERRVPTDYIERFFRDGEVAAMRDQLQLNGIAAEPPAGWLPDNPTYRAWLTGAPVPAAR